MTDSGGLTIYQVSHGATRMNFAVPNLLSAAIFMRRLEELEAAHKEQPFGEFWQEILALATGGIFVVAAAIESYANEVFADRTELLPTASGPVLDLLWAEASRALLRL